MSRINFKKIPNPCSMLLVKSTFQAKKKKRKLEWGGSTETLLLIIDFNL